MTKFSTTSNSLTLCATLATAVATYTFWSMVSSPTCTPIIHWQSKDDGKVAAASSAAHEQSFTRGAAAAAASQASLGFSDPQLKAPLLCPIRRDDNDALYRGRWIYNESITTFPYLGGEDYVWGPRCTDLEKRYLFDRTVPDYLKYHWQPESCNVAKFDRNNFCRLLNGKTIGIIGDSMQQQFAHSLVGMMLGHLPSNFTNPNPPIDYSNPKQVIELCPYNNEGEEHYSVTLMFVRWNKYVARDEDRTIVANLAQQSDYLIMNFGVHYQPWLEMEKAIKDLIQVLEGHWGGGGGGVQPSDDQTLISSSEDSTSSSSKNNNSDNLKNKKKKPQRLFWRTTMVAHDNCAASTGPLEVEPEGATNDSSSTMLFHKNPKYNTDEIMLQDRDIVQPLLQASPLLDITVLRIDKTTMALRSDGHRIVGHNGNEDCLHYCEPGPTDSWVELFYHHVVMGI